MAFVYLGIGTNLGEKERNLNDSLVLLSLHIGNVMCVSDYYSTLPWGFVSEYAFLNAVVLLETQLSPFQLLEETQSIEKLLGRSLKTTDVYKDRLIDIDILFYDNLIIEHPELKIPHPLIAERDFVLKPLVQIAPEFVHPILGLKIRDIYRNKI